MITVVKRRLCRPRECGSSTRGVITEARSARKSAELVIGEVEGSLSIAHAIADEIGSVLSEIPIEVAEEPGDEDHERPAVLVGIHPL